MKDQVLESASNKAIRVMLGERLKFTHRVCIPGEPDVEFQSNEGVKIEYLAEARALWISYSGYSGAAIMEWKPGTVILTKLNPGVEDKK
jgi:hypothetical protein